MEIVPIGARVLIEPVKESEKTAGGIYLPESAREGKKRGKVVAVGELEDGKKIPLTAGDVILYGGYSSEEFEVDNKEYLIVDYKDVIAQLKQR